MSLLSSYKANTLCQIFISSLLATVNIKLDDKEVVVEIIRQIVCIVLTKWSQ